MKVALVYDRVNKWGGAERVLLALQELFPHAPLFTSVYNKKKASWAKLFTVYSSFLQKLPYASISHESYAPLMPLAFESFIFDDYDVVISVTSEAAKGIITCPKTLHICYCLTPTRYLWSGYDEYFKNPFLKIFSFPFTSYLRIWDKVASSRPDEYIAISQEVQKRIKKYYKRESLVIYPPLESSFEVLYNTYKNKVITEQAPFFLIVSRLVSFKRIDIAIRASNILKLPLKIVGMGIQEAYLKRIAGPSVEFLGSLTDKELMKYYMSCLALISPGEEDFGLTILEAQRCGKPIIAFKKGGAIETVIEGKTGIFFTQQNVQSLIKALVEFGNLNILPEDCIKQAQRFNKEKFKKEFKQTIDSLFTKRSYI